MQGDEGHGSSPLGIHHPRLRHTTLPYSYSSIATQASTSTSSVWSNGSSDSSSQSSVNDSSFECLSTVSSQTSVSSNSSYGSLNPSQHGVDSKLAAARSWQIQQQQQRPPQNSAGATQLRQHPRRSSATSTVVPSLIRQSDRRTTFVDHLVDASTQIVQAIWPLSSIIGRGEAGNSSNSGSYLLPLRTFIQETLRRSRASYSTLQVALYYLLLIKPRLPSYNFTMEQTNDSHACRALQCGRRMFLAALILASKYLQDRNYSARAWSKISGLSTSEINQNETAFLHAVNWRLHITTEVYNRWIECVNKFNLPQLPPSPGPSTVDVFETKCTEFRAIIQKLSPSLDNLNEFCDLSASATCQMVSGVLSPVSMCSSPEASADSPVSSSSESNTRLASKMCGIVSNGMQHSPATPVAFTPGRVAPAMSQYSLSKLAPPQPAAFNCGSVGGPGSGAAAQILTGSRSSMGFAVAQASNASSNQFLDRWPPALSLSSAPSMSPAGSVLTRRSSLANSVSTASSPESMISDSSLVSRSSSVSSAWSMMNAPNAQLPKLDAQARHRFGLKQQCSGSGLREKCSFGLRPTMIPAVVQEGYESVFVSSPETMYTGPVGKDMMAPANAVAAPPQLPPLGTGLAARRSSEMEAAEAARALAELQQQQYCAVSTDYAKPRPSLKRSRPMSIEPSFLQDNVRNLLRGGIPTDATNCGLESMVYGQPAGTVDPSDLDIHGASRAASLTGSRKRLCRTMSSAGSAAAAPTYSYGIDLQHPPMSTMVGPGMWQGILN